MDESADRRKQLRDAWKEFASGAGEHPGEDEILRYHRGELAEADQARLEAHLAACARCVETLVELTELSAPIPESDREAAPAAFDRLWQRIEPRGASLWTTPRILLPLAATLLVAVILTVIWGVRMQHENRRLTDSLAERTRSLEQETRALEDRLGEADRRRQSDLALVRQPEVNVPIRNIYPRGDLQRSGSQGEGNRIRVPSGTRTFVLILSDFDPRYREYAIEIVDETGRSVWKAEALRPTEAGNLSISLDRTLLGASRFIVVLSGSRNDKTLKIAEYVVSID